MDGTLAIQIRDVGADGEIRAANLQRFDLGSLPERYFVRGGDLVFRSRGEPNTASVIETTMTEPAAVIVPLIIMRPDRTRVLPGYLAWAINRPDFQRRIGAEAQGTNLRMVPLSVLERLDIALPDLEVQHRIVAIDALSKREGQLLSELSARRDQLVGLLLSQTAAYAGQQETIK